MDQADGVSYGGGEVAVMSAVREIALFRVGRLVRYPFRILTRGRWMPDAVTIGFTVIYLVEPWPQLRAHELAHVSQAKMLGRCRFWWRYMREFFRNGYKNNFFEVQARRAAGEEP